MNHYIDITMNPDAEMRRNVLMNKVYTKLHKALFSLKATDIGISFPKCDTTLGRMLRIHGEKSRLFELQSTDWLGGLKGYCHIEQVKRIPERVIYKIISRKQPNMTQAKLNRLLKRGSVSSEMVKQYKAKMFKNGLNNPYLELKSASNGNKYRLYVAFSDANDPSKHSKFDYFGLSKDATVPWF